MASIFVATRVVFFYQGPFPDLPYPNSSGPLRNKKDSPFSSCKISRPSVVSGGSDGQLPIGIELVRFGVVLVRIVKRISGHADDDSFLDANPVARHVSVAFALNSSRPKKTRVLLKKNLSRLSECKPRHRCEHTEDLVDKLVEVRKVLYHFVA